MTSPEVLEQLIRGGRSHDVRRALAPLDEPARKALRPVVTALASREARDRLSREARIALVTAQVGTVSGAAAVTDVLRARAWSWRDDHDVVTGALLDRRPAWLPGVVQRLAERLDVNSVDTAPFAAVETLRLAAGLPRPRAEAYLRGLAHAVSSPQVPVDLPDLLRRDPEIADLVPHLLSTDDIGPLLLLRDIRWVTDDRGRIVERVEAPVEQTWPGALARAAEDGVLDRAVLLGAVLESLLRGGKREHVAGVLAVHEGLVPTSTEVGEHRRTYTRLVADGPGTVATVALRLLRTAAGEGSLEADGVLEAADAAVRRREKGLATAGLSWSQQVAEAGSVPVDEVARVVASALGHERRDVQERALRVLGTMAATLQPGTLAGLRAEAVGLPAVLRPDAEAVLGPLEPAVTAAPAAASVPVVRAPAAPVVPVAPAEPRVRDLADLAAAVAAHLEDGDPRAAERVLDGVARFAAADPDGFRSAMRPFAQRLRTSEENRLDRERSGVGSAPGAWGSAATRLLGVVLAPRSRGWFGRPSRPQELERWTVPDGVAGCLDLRAREIAGRVLEGRAGPLLATPTGRTGALDPEVALARVQEWARLGVEPGAHDLEQAWLRLPRGVPDPSWAARVRAIGSRAAGWLAGAVEHGPPEPRYVSAPVPPTVGRTGYAMPAEHAGILVVDVLPPPGDPSTFVVRALTPAVPLPVAAAQPWWDTLSGGWAPLAVLLTVPQHREAVAAHLAVALLGTSRQCPPEVAATVALLPEVGGADGPATALAIGWAAAGSDLAARTAAADALRGFALTGGLNGHEAGRVLGPFLLQPTVSLGRVAGTLADAARGDRATQRLVWELLAGALPAVLPSGRRGVADLLGVAAEAAAEVGATGTVTGLDAVAGRGSTALATEARRLRDVLAGRVGGGR